MGFDTIEINLVVLVVVDIVFIVIVVLIVDVVRGKVQKNVQLYITSHGSICQAQPSSSSSWTKLALVSINLTTYPPTLWESLFVTCLIKSIEACVA